MTTLKLNVLVDNPLELCYVELPYDARVASIRHALINDWGTPAIGRRLAKMRQIDYFEVPPGVPAPFALADRAAILATAREHNYTRLHGAHMLRTSVGQIDQQYLQILLITADRPTEKAQELIDAVFATSGLSQYTSRLITMHVAKLDVWTREDVHNWENAITLLWESTNIQNCVLDRARDRLRQQRVISDRALIDHERFKYVTNALHHAQCPTPFDIRSSSDNPPPAPHSQSPNSTLVSWPEIVAFDVALESFRMWMQDSRADSSMKIDVWVSAATIAPPLYLFASGTTHPETRMPPTDLPAAEFCRNSFLYKHGEDYGLSFLVQSSTASLSKYTPKPDFLLMPARYFPVLLGEVVSDPLETDRNRLLLQLATCSRLVAIVSEREERRPVVVQAVYITRELIAEHYLAHANIPESGSNLLPPVQISREIFQLTTVEGLVGFLRTMYNSHGLFLDIDQLLQSHLASLCANLRKAAKAIPSIARQKSSRGSSVTAPSSLPSIAEYSDNLAAMDYHVTEYSKSHPNIAYATDPLHSEVVLKFLSKSCGDEVEINTLQSLNTTPHNHIIPFAILLHTETGSIIATPRYTPLNRWYSRIPAADVLALGQQLLKAVDFMHSRGVAHRDLKPANVVLGSRKGGTDGDSLQLYIIDFNLAKRVDGRHSVARGFIGTEGYTAPEVVQDRSFPYSIIEADLWATGRLLEELMSHSDGREVPELRPLLLACRQLMDPTPAQRSDAGKVLETLMASLDGSASVPRLAIQQIAHGSKHVPIDWSAHSTILAAH